MSYQKEFPKSKGFGYFCLFRINSVPTQNVRLEKTTDITKRPKPPGKTEKKKISKREKSDETNLHLKRTHGVGTWVSHTSRHPTLTTTLEMRTKKFVSNSKSPKFYEVFVKVEIHRKRRT